MSTLTELLSYFVGKAKNFLRQTDRSRRPGSAGLPAAGPVQGAALVLPLLATRRARLWQLLCAIFQPTTPPPTSIAPRQNHPLERTLGPSMRMPFETPFGGDVGKPVREGPAAK